MRLFFALLLDDAVIARVAALIEALRVEASTTQLDFEPPEKVHCTLKFLGEVDDSQLGALIGAATSIAQETAPFEISPSVLGAFPHPASPRILWLGIDRGAPQTLALATAIDRALASLGHPRDARPHHAHLTLARAKGKGGERALKRLLAAPRLASEFPATNLDRFVLMQSQEGGYRVKQSFRFGRG